MTRVFARRFIDSVIVLWLASVVVFVLLRVLPGDPAFLLLGENATPDLVAAKRHELGLDRPLAEQYVIFVAQAVRGNLGDSIRAQRPSLPYVLERFPATLLLTFAATVLAIGLGLPIGILSAVRRGSIYDAAARGLAVMAQSTPNYWLGLVLITVFAVGLRWLPTSGYGGVRNLILPSITLSFVLLGLIVRVTRTEILEVLGQDYVRTAVAKGLPPAAVFSRHALRNALIPILTLIGVQVGTLLGGAVVTETVFAWPGVGYLTVQGVYQRDYPIVQTAVLLSAMVFVVINALIDVMYVLLDPRVRYD
jgi:ABC-type dipeptide/oligopeptide/nickel transport system permease component